MPSLSPRFKEFPQGRWWVKWIEWAASGGGAPGQATVDVVLQKVPDDAAELSASSALAAAKSASQRIVRVLARYLPVLASGAIFRDGVPDGRLLMTRRSLIVEIGDGVADMACSDLLTSKPSWWSNPHAPVVLNSSLGYPKAGRCLVVENRDKVTVIPAFVVVGALLARSSALVRAMVEQPWALGCKELVMAVFFDRATRSGRIELAEGIKSDNALSIAALLPGLNDNGFAAASAVHASIAAYGRLCGWLPFAEGKHVLQVAGGEVYDGKFLVMGIEVAPWPGPASLETVEPGKIIDDPDDPTGFFKKPTVEVMAKEFEAVDAISDENPADDRLGGTILSEATRWNGAPSVTISRGPTRTRAGKVAVPSPASSAEKVSLGEAPGEEFVGKTDATQTLAFRSVDRFELIATAFDTLSEAKNIADWSFLRPRKGGQLRGQRFVWSFPGRKKSRWPIIDKRKGIPRTAMVAEITRIDRIQVYWIEIETAGAKEAFRALAFTARTATVEDLISKLLRHVSEKRGVWGDPKKIPKAPEMEFAACFSHGACDDGRLNARRVLGVINSLVAEG